MTNHPPHKISTVILGCGGVGKSALTLRFMYDEFVEEYEPTKCDAYTKPLIYGEKEYQLSIVDTAGQEEYEFVTDNHIRAAAAFLITFSLVDKETFDSIDEYVEKIQRIKNDAETNIILIGNKQDLAVGDARKITTEEAQEKAEKYEMKYIETSARDNINVSDCFHAVVENIHKTRKESIDVVKPLKVKRRFKCDIV